MGCKYQLQIGNTYTLNLQVSITGNFVARPAGVILAGGGGCGGAGVAMEAAGWVGIAHKYQRRKMLILPGCTSTLSDLPKQQPISF